MVCLATFCFPPSPLRVSGVTAEPAPAAVEVMCGELCQKQHPMGGHKRQTSRVHKGVRLP